MSASAVRSLRRISDRESGRVYTTAPPGEAAAAVATKGRNAREFLIIVVTRNVADKSCSNDAMAIMPFVELLFVIVDVAVDFAGSSMWMLTV